MYTRTDQNIKVFVNSRKEKHFKPFMQFFCRARVFSPAHGKHPRVAEARTNKTARHFAIPGGWKQSCSVYRCSTFTKRFVNTAPEARKVTKYNPSGRWESEKVRM